ncbi:MAG: sodium:solute symporter [Deltaproteobacteria bacterium]|nr:sodium:solute symporter [Deltaproteobacteria bacterium]
MNTAPVLATTDLSIVVGFLLIVTLVGYLLSKVAARSLDDYFLGGRNIPWWILGVSTSASNFDISGTMVIVAVVFSLGLRGFLVEIRGGVGVTLAFLLVFLAKWLRRSRVMTSAEWMKIRFGDGPQGRAAHLLSALSNIALSLGMIIYFAKGSGKFLAHFLPYSELTCTSAMVGIGFFYTVMSGLYGVVFTDLIQMILLAVTAIYVALKGFALSPSVTLPSGFLTLGLTIPNSLGEALLAKAPTTWSPIFGAFGICVAMWLGRTVLEGMGGVGGYTDQRFFAARNEREASLLTLEAITLAILRWAMVAGLVVMGYHVLAQGGPAAELISGDAEQVLPVVLAMLPVGLKGVVLAGLVAAAMSTFDSTLNAGASYVVRDVYQAYIAPNAAGPRLIRVSRLATVALCLGGIALAAIVPNINQIWGLLTMGIGAGMFTPLFLRWYWPRFNGWGFAAGTAAGLVAALVVNTALAWPLYWAFPTVIALSLLAAVAVTLLTPAIDDAQLIRFYSQINPWGFWGRIARLAASQGRWNDANRAARSSERFRDGVSLVFALPFQVCVLLSAMTWVFRAWSSFYLFATISLLSGGGLYLTWYRNLKSPAACANDEAEQSRLEQR